ncbi:hypothetical protein G6F62_013024 [Rhizopus arrhizus]|nr:hypothetical protein G6F24_014220 [Rhizopus arrhizus]KAG1317212.1 hypothetical protein G6F62_013024 [Rhizopus arrhizus]KAG1388875.1 hypothetical protein G6F60_013550 [Rhizopus arrhizus]
MTTCLPLTVATIFLNSSRGTTIPCLVDECLQSTVESHPRSPLPSSPAVSHYAHPTDSSSPPTTSNDDYSESAISPMVPSRSPADQVSTNPDHRPVDSGKRFRPTSITEEQEVDPSLKRLRLSSQALSVINSSTSSFSEKSPYVQTTFIDWCEVRGIDYTLHSVFSVLNLLAEQRLLENWKTSTVFTYASSILQLYTVPDQASIRQSEEYILFCKNLKANTVLPLKSWDYDISPALNYLLSLGDCCKHSYFLYDISCIKINNDTQKIKL